MKYNLNTPMKTFQEFIYSELPIKKELQTLFSKEEPSIIFDIGACEGEDSIRYSFLFKRATVYSFEPLPNNYLKCLNNFAKFPDNEIKAFQLALSNNDGFANFYVSSGRPEGTEDFDWDFGNKSSSLYPPDPSYNENKWLNFKESIEVKTETILSFCKNQSIDKIDFIHMDVQGAELDVLKGAGNKLKLIKAIWLEVENVSMYEGQPLRTDIEEFMKQSKFRKVIDTSIYGDTGDQLYINSLYYSSMNFIVIKYKILSVLKLIYFEFMLFRIKSITKRTDKYFRFG